ncbi:glycoside hydrolase superfamily [Kockovaella imperatae]|uniref:non-reducing end alpha-L-arabinofuranosidase n=1 Tax=Kockovaella imperatae TaxID=4999 RepID=A0A1Y1UJN6_9TREE|nr:glycoside hydrolase superfamily [Kockovaella imperatae]ORX38263.1 glycoside hydrolase superfamily [Kockovaella imperatae]
MDFARQFYVSFVESWSNTNMRLSAPTLSATTTAAALAAIGGQVVLAAGSEAGILAPNYIIASNSNVTEVTLSITTQDKSKWNATAPNLYGLMFEDIDHSGDGGIYAELIANRAFSGGAITGNDNPIEPYQSTLDRWVPIGDTQIALDLYHPLSDALPNSMAMTFPANATGRVGVLNTGFWGMDVSPQTYTGSFWINAVNQTYPPNNTTDITVDLRSNLTSDIWVNTTISNYHIGTFRYSQVNFTLENNVTAPNANNTFAITFDASQVAGQTFYLSLTSLFPETFKGRPNGLRKDLAEAFYDLKPGFLRCPGGNNIEGNSIAQRWKWYETIGPLENRPGRIGTWGYWNTDGLGLMEYLDWCEDMEMIPLLAVYDGYSLDHTSYPLEFMDEVLDEILAELEFCLGDTSTKWGAKRAEYGHPEPYNITYVEIGNEDMFSCTYTYRLNYLYPALKKAYPNIRFIQTQYNENAGGGYADCGEGITVPIRDGGGWDAHHYETPSFYLDTFNYWDNFEAENNFTDIEIVLGEYSVFQLDTSTGYVNYSDPPEIHPAYPELISAIGEGIYMLSAERNPSLVTLMSYAPSLQNLNLYVWTPNMIVFQAQHNLTVLTASYWQQHLFANFRGTHTVPVEGELNPLYWVGVVDESSGAFYLKIVNTGNQTVPLTLNFDSGYYSVNGTTLQSEDPNVYNSVDNLHAIEPRMLTGSELPQPGNLPSNATTPVTMVSSSAAMTGSASAAPTMGSISVSDTIMGGNVTATMSSSGSGSAAATKRSIVDSIRFESERFKRWSNDTNTWSWTVPVFSSTVLQFNP